MEVMSFNVGRMVQAFSAGLALLSSQIWIGDHSKNNWLLLLEAAGHEHRAYSRIPIYRENPDFITGYVLKQNVLEELLNLHTLWWHQSRDTPFAG